MEDDILVLHENLNESFWKLDQEAFPFVFGKVILNALVILPAIVSMILLAICASGIFGKKRVAAAFENAIKK